MTMLVILSTTTRIPLVMSGNLLAIYDHNADGVHESNEYRIIIAHAWRAALESLGLLAVAA